MTVEIHYTKRGRGRPPVAEPAPPLPWAERVRRRTERKLSAYSTAVEAINAAAVEARRLAASAEGALAAHVAAVEAAGQQVGEADRGTVTMLLTMAKHAQADVSQALGAAVRVADDCLAAVEGAGELLRDRGQGSGGAAGKRPCIAGGKSFDSLTAAAKANGLKLATARARILSPTWGDWYYADAPKQTTQPTRNPLRGRPVVINGAYYDRVSVAAEALRIPLQTAYARVKSKQRDDWRYATKTEIESHKQAGEVSDEQA